MQKLELQIKSKEFLAVLIVVGVAVLMRVMPHAPNFSPVASIALFGGAYLPKKFAFALPILIMIISDVFLGFSQSAPFVYGSFLITALLGTFLRERKNVASIFGLSILSSVIFFLVTNFGFWLTYSLYPKTFAGQMGAYINALPFYKNTFLSNILYTSLFFGGYALFVKAVKGVRHANLYKNWR